LDIIARRETKEGRHLDGRRENQEPRARTTTSGASLLTVIMNKKSSTFAKNKHLSSKYYIKRKSHYSRLNTRKWQT
jgi:hypothetical protein